MCIFFLKERPQHLRIFVTSSTSQQRSLVCVSKAQASLCFVSCGHFPPSPSSVSVRCVLQISLPPKSVRYLNPFLYSKEYSQRDFPAFTYYYLQPRSHLARLAPNTLNLAQDESQQYVVRIAPHRNTAPSLLEVLVKRMYAPTRGNRPHRLPCGGLRKYYSVQSTLRPGWRPVD